MKIIFRYFAALLIVMYTLACTKDSTPEPETPNPIDQLKIPDGFIFESTKEVSLTLILPGSVVLNESSQRADIYAGLPTEGGKLVYSASFPASGKLDINFRVPTATSLLYVHSFAGDALVDLNAGSTKEGGIQIDLGAGMGFEPPIIAEGEKSVIHSDMQFGAFAQQKQTDAFVNLIENGDFSNNDFGDVIADWSSPMPLDGKWHITSTLGVNYAQQQIQEGERFLRITKSPARYGGVAQLIPVQGGDLITLTADFRTAGHGSNRVWLFLISRNAAGQSTGFWSIETAGITNNWVTKTIAATMPNGTTSVQVLLWNHIYGGTIDYDNVIVTGPVTDSDGDGVDDELDEYPNDSERAFNVYYPNIEDFGTLAFEDLWPGKGDYDFNDLVIDYQFKQVLNGDNELVEIYMDYVVRAIGASLENGFGIEFPGTSPADIASISGTNLTESYISLNSNGTEQNQENAVVILFDNAFSMIDTPSGGFGVNTSPEAEYVEPVMRQLQVLFANPAPIQEVGFAPFNPFLIVDKTRGREVHLAGNLPTSLHDPAYFGEWFDDTNPAIGKYYQSESNLPWGIDLPTTFQYPIEKVLVTEAYLKFADWAESGGTLFPDWYKDENGYQNPSLIYTHDD